MDENYISIPPADGGPSLLTPWGSEFSSMIERGVQCAQAWLDAPGEIPLWWELAQIRKTFPVGDCQDAFEAAFLLRIQQRLRGLPQ
ncbi:MULTISPECIES: LasR-specific antiactivator QslA [unclassified Pseudomonas]|uniref:LasR-specific antiactivator QslA n=1 Tax=unclassified Pseudomonas TaxID=196821 RepID=UPI00215D40C1|nr:MULTISPECIES: LasR-specific antiactivator QslA [unclassified Pseudomonas]MCR8932269.1 LasR-specific antiactivator QslA [Pseudomonas sp. S11A4]MCR8975876.1 LasR-specific antiactivator QslA [Pseudomonas sp. S11P7]